MKLNLDKNKVDLENIDPKEKKRSEIPLPFLRVN